MLSFLMDKHCDYEDSPFITQCVTLGGSFTKKKKLHTIYYILMGRVYGVLEIFIYSKGLLRPH